MSRCCEFGSVMAESDTLLGALRRPVLVRRVRAGVLKEPGTIDTSEEEKADKYRHPFPR